MGSEAEAVVREFCAAWERRDPEELLGFLAPDAVYHNIPMDPARGHEAIRGVFDLFLPQSDEITFEILHIASTGDVVLTERVDRFAMGDRSVDLPVMGTFEIRDGKIVAWRDYFDLQQFMAQAQG